MVLATLSYFCGWVVGWMGGGWIGWKYSHLSSPTKAWVRVGAELGNRFLEFPHFPPATLVFSIVDCTLPNYSQATTFPIRGYLLQDSASKELPLWNCFSKNYEGSKYI